MSRSSIFIVHPVTLHAGCADSAACGLPKIVTNSLNGLGCMWHGKFAHSLEEAVMRKKEQLPFDNQKDFVLVEGDVRGCA